MSDLGGDDVDGDDDVAAGVGGFVEDCLGNDDVGNGDVGGGVGDLRDVLVDDGDDHDYDYGVDVGVGHLSDGHIYDNDDYDDGDDDGDGVDDDVGNERKYRVVVDYGFDDDVGGDVNGTTRFYVCDTMILCEC